MENKDLQNSRDGLSLFIGKRRLVSMLMLFFTAIVAVKANPVDMRTAREVAVKFVNANARTPLRSADDLQLVTTYTISRGDAAFHIFNTPNGFIIVSADDCATPILGYSDDGQFELENIPVQLTDYLDGFIEQIQFGIEHRLAADEVAARQWESVRTYGTLYGPRVTTNAVEPLLTSTWDQGCYYNNLCPQGGPCGHALTGCVATAMGQIMRYWGYPTNGSGSVTYKPDSYPQQSVNFMEAFYDYDNMPDYLDNSSSSTQVNAVATLLWHCGVAVHADYGSYGTYAYHSYVPTALKNYFLYSSDLYGLNKDDVGNAVWLNQVKSCLDLSRPLYYCGGGGAINVASHAFVCDGYDNNDLLHFNWGWGGVDDGYFALTALHPTTDNYTSHQYAIFDIHPACNGEMYQVSVPCSPSEGGTVSGTGTYECGSVCTLTATASEGYRFYYWSKDGEQISLDETYSFVVMDNNELVANFGSPIEITATANPEAGGVVNGGGEYHYGHTCTLTAIPNEGYVFNNWTKDGEVVSYFSSYSFLVTENVEYVANFQETDGIVIGDAEDEFYDLPMATIYSLSQQIYTAEEMGGEACEVSCVSFFNTGHLSSTHRITVYMVNTDKTAFENYTDWIAVTEADQVYSGSVTIGAKRWSTIYFDTPFIYDGSSNMALIVDDNTGAYVDVSYYRTFNTDESQAIYTYSASTNFDPYNPSGYSGGLKTQKNHIILGLPSYDYTVTVTAEPDEYGTVSGGGMYYYRQLANLTATVNEGYGFSYWSENGASVSTDANYSFKVTSNRNLVAHFSQAVSITATADPNEGGIVSGAGTYGIGSTCRLSATANSGYVFINWTKNGNAVSYVSDYNVNVNESCEYVAHFEQVSPDIVIGQAQQASGALPSDSDDSFGFSQQIYTSDEIGQACEISSISFFNTGYTKIRNYSIYLAHTYKNNFQNSRDWIEVTEADKFFSGDVTLAKNTWTVIPFDVPFNYNGTSNLVLVMVDNSMSGLYDDYPMSCRVFKTENYQSLVATNDYNSYNPYNYYYFYINENYEGVRNMVKNQIILGIPSYDYMVTTSADPEEGGTVSGGGPCYYNQRVTISATANEGYMFSYWTKDGTVISKVSNYSFHATESGEYVAHFEPISSSITIGTGQATSSYLPSYSYYKYGLSQQIYTADEIGMAGTIRSIAFYNGGAEETRVYDVYMALTDKNVFDSNTDWIAVTEADKVFSGTALMVANAWTFFALDTPFEYDGTSNLVLVMDDNSGSYTSSPHMACRVFNANGNQAIRIYSNSPNFNPYNPSGYSGTRQTVKNHLILGIEADEPQVQETVSLSAGLNWWSTNLDITLDQLKDAIAAAVGNTGTATIKSQNGSVSLTNGNWRPANMSFDIREMYQIVVSSDCEITLTGVPVNPSEYEITIHNGINWIGFLPAESMPVDEAFSGLNPSNGDVIKSKGGSSTYNGTNWRGSVQTLEPGQGYIYQSTASDDKTFVFGTNNKK